MRLLKPLITKIVVTVAVVVSLLPTMHFSVACDARGLTVTEPTTPVSVLRAVAARVCDGTMIGREGRIHRSTENFHSTCPKNKCLHEQSG